MKIILECKGLIKRATLTSKDLNKASTRKGSCRERRPTKDDVEIQKREFVCLFGRERDSKLSLATTGSPSVEERVAAGVATGGFSRGCARSATYPLYRPPCNT